MVITIRVGTSLFVTVAEPTSIKRGTEDSPRKVVSYLPNNRHRAND
jgi:hypothetical protein